MAEGVLIGRHNAEALDQIVRQWEAAGRRFDRARATPTPTSHSAPIVQAIEVTSSTADADGYPARIQLFDGTSWTDSYAECRAVKIGGGTLATGFYPPGRLMGVSPTGLHIYGVHPGAAAASGTELKGLTFTSDTDSTADSDPGAGLFKWNNATQSSASFLYFDLLTADGLSVADFFGALNGGGFVYLQQADDSTKWQLYKWLTAPASAAGYYKIPVTHLQSGGSIADAKTVYTIFSSYPIGAGAVLGDIYTTSTLIHDSILAADIGSDFPALAMLLSHGNLTDPTTLGVRFGGSICFGDTTEANFTSISEVGGGLNFTSDNGTPIFIFNGTVAAGTFIQGTGGAPASAGAAGVAGQFGWDSSFFYVCVATDTWKRVAIATW